jgi:uncharacterized protein YecE (DUF72 family)
MLEQYATVFEAVELDTTFYGAPRVSTLKGWRSAVPDGFLFSAKTPKAITHDRRLRDAAEAGLDFGTLLQKELGTALGALLLQLPPDFTPEERPVLEAFLETVTSPRYSSGLPWVVEFRDAGWQNTDIVTVLAQWGVGVATTERVTLEAPLRYLRLLGVENSVARFDTKQFDRSEDLDTWAERIRAAQNATIPDPILVFARNFFEGHAPETLRELRRRLGLTNVTPPGQKQMSLF